MFLVCPDDIDHRDCKDMLLNCWPLCNFCPYQKHNDLSMQIRSKTTSPTSQLPHLNRQPSTWIILGLLRVHFNPHRLIPCSVQSERTAIVHKGHGNDKGPRGFLVRSAGGHGGWIHVNCRRGWRLFYTLHLILGNFGFTPPMRSEVADGKRLYRFGSARSLRSFSVNILGEWMMTSITLGLIGRKGSSSPNTEDAVVRSFHCKRTR